MSNKQGLAEKDACRGAALGTLHGILEAVGQLQAINRKYEKHKNVINSLQAELDCLAPKIREKARKVDDMAETMEDLKV